MMTLHRYEVQPAIPAELEPLTVLAKNLWWSWNESARDLFARIDPDLYERVSENPIAVLYRTPQERLDALARDAEYVAELGRIRAELDAYLARETWFDRTHGGSALAGSIIAYFSMEFGVHESVPVYSGGLGVLAGDHLKSASDLGLPLVGVGVAFSQGYFRQSLDHEGWQTERYPPNDWHDLPVSPVTDAKGDRVEVGVSLPAPGQPEGRTRQVALQAWRVDVGRVPLYLLDANLPGNAPEDRALTNTLYGGDRNHRIRQEILLGVGGVRLLEAIGVRPAICHMNEGHSAFLALERVRQLMEREGASFAAAAEAGSAGNVFTTHTPVPAGNDAFAHDLIAPYLRVLSEGLGIGGEGVLRLGKADPAQPGGEFSMPVLAIRMADRYNGVSMLHGREARAMWRLLWPQLAEHEVPIGSITNGVHLGTWIARDTAALYARYLGPSFLTSNDPALWGRIADVPDAELWALRERSRARLVQELPERLRALTERKGLVFDPGKLPEPLDPHALTIGFARRFATYKRGTLLLRDAERLHRILSRPGKPVQLVFAGKAHPQDWGGKELIRDIVRASRSDAFRGRIVFVEDYDMSVARALVSGVDVWLNTPRRPLEASGTSGMKAAINGVLNASVLDGWWAEAYAGDNGFGIGHGEEYADAEYGDRVEAQALYRLLEDELCPLFYDRDEAGLPRGWIARMKRCIATVAPVFNTGRMVEEYTARLYDPAAARYRAMTEGGLARARALCDWRARIDASWPEVRVESVTDHAPRPIRSGQDVAVTVDVQLGTLTPADVRVEAYHGRLRGDEQQAITDGAALALRHTADLGAGRHRYEGSIPARQAGEHAFAVRVLPHEEALPNAFATRLLAWQ